MPRESRILDPAAVLTAREAAETLGVSRSTLNRWLKEGRIKGVKVGKQWRFTRDALLSVVDIGGREADRRQASLEEGLSALAASLRAHGVGEDRLERFAAELADREVAGEVRGQAWDFVRTMMLHAMETRSSDVHLEPQGGRGVIRFRAGEGLQDLATLSTAAYDLVAGEWKFIAGLDPADSGVPEDGRIMLGIGGQKVDVLIATYPTRHGSAVTLRFLDNDPATDFSADLARIVPDAGSQMRIRALNERPNGLLLVAGPTMSGKSTLQYALLRESVATGAKIMTIEDPILHDLDGVTQAEVDRDRGLTLASYLRSIQRSAPDIVLCEDVRDEEVAHLLTRLSLAGRKVLSTVHARDCHAGYAAWHRSGVKPILALSALQGVISTRFLRRNCPDCRTELPLTEAHARRIGELLEGGAPGSFHVGAGCDACRRTGYRGRILLTEVSIATDEIRDGISNGAPKAEIEQAMAREGWSPFRELALGPLRDGETSVQEVLGLMMDVS